LPAKIKAKGKTKTRTSTYAKERGSSTHVLLILGLAGAIEAEQWSSHLFQAEAKWRPWQLRLLFHLAISGVQEWRD
jgi:hypothetical protein